jgi:isoleucyl-tRNA synthetase
VGSVEELRKLGKNIPDDDTLDLHRPQVDGYELECPGCGGQMKRVTEVIDAWFDSGSMPFSQYHYPFDENKMFDSQFPAHFICEGIDQSRGWFYSMLAISTFLKGESSYRSCVVTELILDKKGQKMSKSRGNAVEPWDVLHKEGADALRWYLIVSSPPWLPTRFDRKGVVEASQKLLGTLRNVYSFFAMYAALDDFRLSDDKGDPGLLDRWILSRYHSTVAEVRKQLDGFDMTRAARAIQSFIIDELSNWYVRRSRRRFWKGEMGPDKVAAYNTLYTVLGGTVRLLAPFAPFISEEIYQALEGALSGLDETDGRSVHLETFPKSDAGMIDTELEAVMDTALKVSSMGRTVRNEAGTKIRQPLAEMLIHDNSGRAEKLLAHEEIRDIVVDELHVKKIGVASGMQRIARLKAAPAFPALGKRFGKKVPEVAGRLKDLPQDALEAFVRDGETMLNLGEGDIRIGREEMSIGVEGVSPYGAWHELGITVALNLEIDEVLRMEGVAREIVNRLQNLRKKANYNVSDRIAISYEGGELAAAVFERQGELIRSETLAVVSDKGGADWVENTHLEVEGERIDLWIRRESN